VGAGTSDGPVVEARGITVRLGGRSVLAGASFEVRRGEVLAVLGPNGAGKTTLLECLVGVRRPDAGEVRRGDRPLRTIAEHAAVFGFLPDRGVLPPELRVGEILREAAAAGGAGLERARELGGALGLSGLLGASAGALSRGEAQRVALAAALVAERPVLVLDEPFGAFDPLQLRDVLEVVRARASRAAIVASIHQLSDAEKIADRALLLAGGRIVGQGTLAELRAQAGAADLEGAFVQLLASALADPAGAPGPPPGARPHAPS